MGNHYVLIGVAAAAFFTGTGIGYTIFTNTYDPVNMMGNPQMFNQMMTSNPQMMNQWMGYMMQNPQYMNQWMSQNPQYMGQWMGSMMSDPQLREQMYDHMFQNQQFMYGMMGNSNFQNNYMGPWMINNTNWRSMMGP
jgi:hypothetical protein